MPNTNITFNNKVSGMANLAKTLGSAVGNFATNTAQQAIQGIMGHQANLASAQGQSAAADFNAGQASAATQQNVASMAQQWDFNSAQAQNANQFTQNMWNQTAAWNEKMWQKQADFNAEQAEIQRSWQERMSNTQYQRAMADMEKAGLNPILAYGGISGGVPGGAQASVSGTNMSSAQGAMASGGLLGSEMGSISGYQGQAEWTGGILALLGAAIGQLGSAQQMFGQMGKAGENMFTEVVDTITDENFFKNTAKSIKDEWVRGTKNQKDSSYTPNYRNGIDWNMKDYGGSYYRNDGSRTFKFLANRAKG